MIRVVGRRVRNWANRLTTRIRTRHLLGASGRWEVVRHRPVPGVDFLMVLNAGDQDPVTVAIRHGGNSTAYAIELLRQLTPAGDRVIDLGAHVGQFCLTAAALGYEVLVVEASLANASLLSASARLNGFNNLHIVHCAIGDRPRLDAFCENGPYGFVGGSRSRRPGTVRVPVLSGDGILAEMGWNKVAFVKMDVEGSEIAAIAGLQTLLQRDPAPAVVVESNEVTCYFFGHTTPALQHAFTDLGYHSYQIGDRRLTPCTPDDVQGLTCVDYLAVKTPLPTIPPGWRVTVPFSQEELAEQFLSEITNNHNVVRASIARRLGQADTRLLALPAAQAALQRLLHDEDAEVRQAVEWYARRLAA